MSSAGSLGSISSGTRKILPVDVQDGDGLFTRGFVQDILDDGKVLVHFNCRDDLLKTVEPERLFRPRSLTESKGYSRDDDIFHTGTKVEVLVRVSPGSTARWYAGTASVEDEGNESLVEVEVGDGEIRRGLFGNVFHSASIQLPLSRTCARFTKLTLPFTKEVEVSDIDEDFFVEWEEQTGSFITTVDLKKKLFVVLVQEETQGHYPPSSRKFEEILFQTCGFGFANHSGALIAARDHDEADGDLDRVLDYSSAETAEESSTALMIPEMLVHVFRFLDLKNRQILRRVCGTWRDVMDSAQVCGSAHFDDSLEERQPLSTSRNKKSSWRGIKLCRYLSKLHQENLTTIAVHCDSNSGHADSGTPFADLLAFMGPVLVPQLKTLILYDGHVSLMKLIWGSLQLKSAPRILLENVTLDSVVIVGILLPEMHVRVKAGTLDLTLTDLDDAIPDDLTGLQGLGYDVDDEVKRALISLRRLLVCSLAGIPLGCREEIILAEIAGTSQEWVRQYVSQALKVLDLSCFKPEMEDYGTEIRLAKSSLQNSTLHICKAMLAHYYETPYRCGDIACCKKRKRS